MPSPQHLGMIPEKGIFETASEKGIFETASEKGIFETASEKGIFETASEKGIFETASEKGTKKPEAYAPGFLRTNTTKMKGLSQPVHRFYKIFILFDGLIGQH